MKPRRCSQYHAIVNGLFLGKGIADAAGTAASGPRGNGGTGGASRVIDEGGEVDAADVVRPSPGAPPAALCACTILAECTVSIPESHCRQIAHVQVLIIRLVMFMQPFSGAGCCIAETPSHCYHFDRQGQSRRRSQWTCAFWFSVE